MVIISGGAVVDGTGAPRVVADVAFEGDTIVAIGDLRGAEGTRIDARGRLVAPGLIDLHTHSDATVLGFPSMSSSVRQGVTTEVGGNCGMQVGLALGTSEFELEQRLYHGPHPFCWTSLAEFAALVEEQGIAGNIAFLAGHGTLRKRVMGWQRGAPAPEALARMRAFLRQTLEEGAFGLSTGLEYPPGSYATHAEIAPLVAEVAAVGGLYTTHLRNEGDHLAEAVEEELRVACETGVRLQISHLKAERRRNWGKAREMLARIHAARAAGIDIACDVYPYTAFMTGLWVATLPAWAQEIPAEELSKRIQEPGFRDRVANDMAEMEIDWEQLQVAIAPQDRSLQGRTMAEIARERGVASHEAVLDLLAGGLVVAIVFAISEEEMRLVLRAPFTSVASDGTTRVASEGADEDRVHPRCFGTFPRVLGRYAREEGLLSWEEAIHRMTGLPASRLGLRQRGVIRPGARADLVVFDPETVLDTATFVTPASYPRGIEHVFVNGVAVVRDGEETGARPGRVLRRGQAE
ncbi:MAG TPA: D-aminoacylase [Armatimonadetes bacterium]|jgi:N-acyl-D-amino-acid deacylase|nr:D-aminoacylase [Armatimonadota bacterium]